MMQWLSENVMLAASLAALLRRGRSTYFNLLLCTTIIAKLLQLGAGKRFRMATGHIQQLARTVSARIYAQRYILHCRRNSIPFDRFVQSPRRCPSRDCRLSKSMESLSVIAEAPELSDHEGEIMEAQ